jgi:[protein-PII] uridylyltransferase
LAERLEPAALSELLAGKDPSIPALRQLLNDAAEDHKRRFIEKESIDALVHDRSELIDHVILAAWKRHADNIVELADLVAVGGYGRGELHPKSDIDLLLLVSESLPDSAADAIAKFLTLLWDIGLEVGHSVRTLDECVVEAAKDITVLTTLMETRLLHGRGALFNELGSRISPDKIWSSADFFRAKVAEQGERHHRYHDTAYNLEPNVKGSPGGLRDIQTIAWIARRFLGTSDLQELIRAGILTQGQLKILLAGRAFLWRIRFGLHVLTERREDRLLFDNQVKLANMLGYEDASFTLAVEQLMQRYYRTVMDLSRLNEMLLQLFEEAILLDRNAPSTPVGTHFVARNGYLEAIGDDVFQRDPAALLEIFLNLSNSPQLKGVNARTIALIKQNLWLIDEEFRQNPRHQRLFLQILTIPTGVTRSLKRMNTYGVLGLYIPAFGRIVGRMQFDLFHAYTVDQHTLFVVENLRRLALGMCDEELPHASSVMKALDRPEVVYLAGLFHDIAKGRGGDHSELGAVDAESFCLEHGLGRYDARLVAWLVRNHLLLSMTAQKKDVNDPTVINEFAATIGDITHLDHLYVLTVADVRATNPKIWNSWKDTLFWELYSGTKRALWRGAADAIDKEELILETKARAEQQLLEQGLTADRWQTLWSGFSDEYYLRHRAEEVTWHTTVMTRVAVPPSLLVDVSNSIADGLTVLMVYAEIKRRSYIRTTATLDDLGLNIVDARIVPISDHHTLNTYFVLDASGNQLAEGRQIDELKSRVQHSLEENSRHVTVHRRTPRQVRMFPTPVRVEIFEEPANRRTVIELAASDRPGLLFQVGQLFEKHRISLQNAKVATIGERAEDVFFVTNERNEPLSPNESQSLKEALESALSETVRD